MKKETEEGYGLLAVLLGSALGLYVVYWLVVINTIDKPEERGQFGDLFGGVNALFTAFAFGGLIFTAVLQRRELRYQRQELEETRKELSGQRKALEAQNTLGQLQASESTFFQLLRLHHEIVNAMVLEPVPEGQRYKGRHAFEAFYRELAYVYQTNAKAAPHTAEGLDEVSEIYGQVYYRYQSTFGHYFRNFYHILKFIDSSILNEKSRYTAFARAQLSSYELACLFYNGLSQQGVEKFKPLAETYTLFDNLPWDVLLTTHHVAHYAGSAFFANDATVSSERIEFDSSLV